MKKRALSWLLALTMLLTLAPQTLPVWASATGETSNTATQTESKLSANTYSALGLSRTIDENQKPSGQPYGNGDVGSTIATNVINELYVNFNGSIHYGWSILDKLTMQCTDQAGDNWTNKENSQGAMSYWRYGQQPKGSTGFGALYASGGKTGTLSSHIDRIGDTKSSSISSANKHLVYQYSKSEAFSPNTGKDNYVAELVVSDAGMVYLYIYQVEGGNKRHVRSTKIGYNHFIGDADNKTNIIWNWEYDAMFDIAAGDMDGDGYDEIAVYSSNKVYVYSYENNTLSKIEEYENKTNLGSANGEDKYLKLRTAVVTLAFGDLNADNKEELVIAESSSYDSDYVDKGTVGIYALDGKELHKEWSTDLKDGDKLIRYANVATGDIDGNYKDELVIAGYYSDNSKTATCKKDKFYYKIIKFENNAYTDSGWGQANQEIDLLQRVVDNSYQLIPPVSLTCAATQGVGYAEQVFLGGCLYTVNNDNSLKYLTRISTNREYKKDDGKKANKEEIFVVNVVAGNFNGNEYGQEQIVYAFGMKHDDSDRYWYDIGYLNKKDYGNTNETNSSGYWYGQEQVMNYESSYNRDSKKSRASLYLSLAAVDCDDDSTLMRYTGQEITWTKPEVLTVLQSAPYFQDLQDTRDYLDQSQTAYGTGHGTSTTATAGASLTLGTYVSFEQDFSVFGVKIASIEAEAQTKHSFEYGFEGSKEKEINITYSGSAGDDYAIVYAVPYIEYQYETWIPGYKIPEENNGYNSWKTEYVGNYLKGKLKNWSTLSADEQKNEIEKAVKELNLIPGREVQGSWQPSTVSVPMDPAKVLISVDAYDEIAAQTEGLEPIRGNILKSTPGDPSTYDSFDANSEFYLIGSTQTVSTGAGGNVSIEETATASQTHTFSYSYEFEAKAGVGAGGLTVGVLAGVGTNAGGGTGTSSSKSCSATVDNLPSDATGYAFSWRFGTRKAKLNGNDVLVLEYQIDKSSLQQPPSPPRNLRVESVTADSVTLEWDTVPGAGSYEIYQTTLTETEDPVCIATVPGTATSYTDQRVLPNNSYTYYIKNVTPKGKSIFSTSIKVSTLLQNDGRFVIEEQPGSNHKFQTYVGGTATATVKAKYVSTDGGEKSLIYIWKKYNSKTKRWENYMSGSETLSVPNVTKNMEGDKFRCQVFYTSGLYMYTEPITLEVGKAETTTAMTGPDTNSTVNASYVEIVKNPVKDDDGHLVYEQVAVTKTIGKTIYTEYTTKYTNGEEDKIVYLSGDDYYSISNETPTKLITEDRPIQLYYDDANDTTKVIDLQESSMIQDLTYPGEGNAKVSYTKTDDQSNKPVIYEADKKYTIRTIEGTIEIYCKSAAGEEDDFWFVKIGTDESGQNKYAPATLEKETTIDPQGINVKVSELRLSTTQGAQMFTSEQKFHSGDTVSLRAKVTENAGFAAAKIEGSVAFKIVNSVGDGSGTVTGTINDQGVATATWKPSVAGVYTITAAYEGSEIHMGSASAGSITINVVVPGEKKLVIDSPNSMTYGDAAIDLKATLLSGAESSGTEGTATDVTSSVTYSVKDAAGNTVSNATADNKFAPKAAGNYTITATCTVDGKSFTATKTINVGKRTVKIVPKVENNGTSYTLENIVSTDKNLFDDKINVTCAGTTTGAAAGQYPINVTYTPGDKETDINSKYLVLVDTTQVYTVSDDVVQVTNATNSNNGTVTLQYTVTNTTGSNTFNLGNGTEVPKGAKLTATASPHKGYKVKKWTVNGTPVYLNGTSGAFNTAQTITVADTVQPTSATDKGYTVKAEFEAVNYNLTFSVEDGKGTVNAHYMNDATEGSSFTSGSGLSPLDTVQLTAKVNDGYSIRGWQVTTGSNKTETIQENGKNYTGSSYKLSSISADTTVTVLVENKTEQTVSIALMNSKENGTTEPLTIEGAKVTFITEEAQDVTPTNSVYTYQGHKHDNLTVKITLPNGWIVDEWTDREGNAMQDNNLSSDKKSWKVSDLSENFAWTVKCKTPNSYTVTTKTMLGETEDISGDSGTITVYKAGTNEVVTSGSSVLQATGLRVKANPKSGYQLMDVALYDGETKIKDLGQNSDFTIDSVNSNINIVANFVKKPVIKITTPTNGTVTANGMELSESTVPYGSTKDIVFTATPKVGYEVDTWKVNNGTVNGTPVPDSDNQTYTYTPDPTTGITSDVTVEVSFKELPNAKVNFSVVDKNDADSGGLDGTLKAVVTRYGTATTYDSGTIADVYRDSVVTFVATPDPGYAVAKWIVNDEEQTAQPTLNIGTDDNGTTKTVKVQFEKISKEIKYGITADSDANHGGTLKVTFLAKAGSKPAEEIESGTSVKTTGTLTAEVTDLKDGYEIESWTLNGAAYTSENGKLTCDVSETQGADIRVKIVRKSYQINFSATAGGTITATANETTLQNPATVKGDTEITFTASDPATGYKFVGWKVDDHEIQETAQSYTLTVTKGTTIQACYAMTQTQYTVTYGIIKTGEQDNGTLSVSGLNRQGKANAGRTITFTATPAAGYQVKQWYSAESGATGTEIGTAESEEYQITNLTENTGVYVQFEPIPSYEITVNVTGQGSVTATVNDEAATISENKLTVKRHDKVVLTASPATSQYLTSWTLDDESKGNDSLTLTLSDVTDNHTVAANFDASQGVTLKTICGTDGTLEAKAGYGDKLTTINAASGISVDKGKKIVLTAKPESEKAVVWTVNGKPTDELSNTYTIDAISANTEVQASFEDLNLFTLTAPGSNYAVSVLEKYPSDYGGTNEVRQGGNISFKITPNAGQLLGVKSVSPDGTVVANADGSYTVTIENVTSNITFQMEEYKAEPGNLIIPNEYTEASLKSALRTQISSSVSGSNIKYLDIKLKINTGSGWQDVTAANFPKGGINITILYTNLGNGLDKSYNYSVAHMRTDGTIENLPATNGENGITFHVNSLSPFAIGWYKNTPTPGGGGGGGGAVSTYTLTFDSNGGSAIDKITKDSGTTIDLATNKPTRAGYTFAGWFSDKALTKAVTSVKLTANTTVYAKWTQNGGTAENPFVDVKEGAYYYDAVLWAVEQKITSGTSATTFSPDASCTRAQMVTFLWRAAGSPKVENGKNPFADVKADAYYYDAVLWAVEKGVTSGTSATTFSPDATVTRGQTVTFLYRNAGSPEVSGTMPFTDVEADAYYAKAVQWAVQQKITTGTSETTFSPMSDCTRGQIVTFLYRAK